MENIENIQENKMGTMKVPRLLFVMAVPMMVSMLVQALYNVVDSVFVSMLSENALTAVSLAFPVQNLMIGVATGTGVGVNALLSRHLGEGDRPSAERVAENGVFLAVLSYLVFLLIGLFASRPFFAMQTSTAEIVEGGTAYLTVCCCASFGVFMQVIFERLMQATGRTVFTMFTQGLGAVINIILDPVFIFERGEGFLGMGVFGMGVTGAAVATVIGQIAAGALAVVFNARFNHDIHLSFRRFRPNGHMIGRIYAIGVPSILMVGVGSLMVFAMNAILIRFTETAAAVFGAYYKLQSFVFMPLFGLNNGVIPIVAFNYGARRRRRMVATVRLSLVVAFVFMMIGLVLLQVIPDRLLLLFNASEQMLAIGVPALRIISLSYLLAGFCVVLGSVFQALGHGLMSMVVALARQLLALVPIAYLLSLTGRLELVWWAFPAAEIVSFTASILCFWRLWRRVIRPIPAGEL